MLLSMSWVFAARMGARLASALEDGGVSTTRLRFPKRGAGGGRKGAMGGVRGVYEAVPVAG